MVALEAQTALVSEVDPFCLKFFEDPLRGDRDHWPDPPARQQHICAHWPARR
jgi:hypothetical protein